jgi:hypothetical protein
MFQFASNVARQASRLCIVVWRDEFVGGTTAMRHELVVEKPALVFLQWFSSLARQNDKLSGGGALVTCLFQPYVGMSRNSYLLFPSPLMMPLMR